MRHHSIAAIPADGIGPEVIGAGLEVLRALERRAGDRVRVAERVAGSNLARDALPSLGFRTEPPQDSWRQWVPWVR